MIFKGVIALDTALNNCSVAVYTAGKSIAESQPLMQGHAEHLMPMVERVLAKAGVEYSEIQAVAVTTGPGAFTGLRIGLSAARSMAMALRVPVYGITTTQILALQAVHEKAEPVAVILETKRQDFYVQMFDRDGKEESEAVAAPAHRIDVKGYRLIGDGVQRFNGQASDLTVPDMALAAELLAEGADYFSEGADPVYLRDADVTSSKRQNRVFEGFTGENKK